MCANIDVPITANKPSCNVGAGFTRPTRLSESDGGQVNPSPTTSDIVLNMDWAAPPLGGS